MSTSMPDMSQPGAQADPQALPPSAAPAAVPSGPHAKLLAMIQGLAVGVGAFAHSAATQGRAGGPADVEAFQQQQQEQQLRSQQSQIAAQTAQRQQQEGDLRMQAMRGQMAVNQFQYEQMRQRAPIETQKLLNDVAEQKSTFIERLAKDSGLPTMVVASMVGDDTGKTLGGMTDVAKQNGTNIHDAMWSNVQNGGTPGNGSMITGLDLAKFGNTPIKAELAPLALTPVKTQLEVGAGVLGEDNPAIKGGRQALEMLQKGLNSGQLTLGQYALLENRISTPIATAMAAKHAANAATKESAEATKATQEADPNFQVAQAGAIEGAKQKAIVNYAGLKSAAEAQGKQPYELALKQAEAPIAAGIANNKDARDKVENSYLKPYGERMQAANELVSSLDQAAAGNVTASKAALYKLTGITLPAGSKRIPEQALKDLNKQGNIPQQFIASLKEAITGDKWTDQTLNDMRAFAQSQAQVAKETLRSGIKSTNALYDTTIDPEKVIGATSALDIDNPTRSPEGSKAAKWATAAVKGATSF
jgi:hypothetical protein